MEKCEKKLQVISTIYDSKTTDGAMNVWSNDFCTMELRLDTVEAIAEHGVLLRGFVEWFVQRNESGYTMPAAEIPYKHRNIIPHLQRYRTNNQHKHRKKQMVENTFYFGDVMTR